MDVQRQHFSTDDVDWDVLCGETVVGRNHEGIVPWGQTFK